MQGRIENIIYSHGFGFIRSSGGRKVFFHRADLLGLAFHRLREGQIVEFYLPWKSGEDIPHAVVVRPPLTQLSPRQRTLSPRTTARDSGV